MKNEELKIKNDDAIIESDDKDETVLCAAIWYRDGKKREHQPRNIVEGVVVCGWRHANCFIILNELDVDYDKRKHTQGFLTSEGRFVNRYEAFALAKKANQIRTMIKNDDENMLTSEDLY